MLVPRQVGVSQNNPYLIPTKDNHNPYISPGVPRVPPFRETPKSLKRVGTAQGQARAHIDFDVIEIT